MSRKIQKAVVALAGSRKSPKLKAKQRRLLEILKRDLLQGEKKSSAVLNGSQPILVPSLVGSPQRAHASQDIATLAQDPADARKAEGLLH
jgi:hypothetical protein